MGPLQAKATLEISSPPPGKQVRPESTCRVHTSGHFFSPQPPTSSLDPLFFLLASILNIWVGGRGQSREREGHVLPVSLVSPQKPKLALKLSGIHFSLPTQATSLAPHPLHVMNFIIKTQRIRYTVPLKRRRQGLSVPLVFHQMLGIGAKHRAKSRVFPCSRQAPQAWPQGENCKQTL